MSGPAKYLPSMWSKKYDEKKDRTKILKLKILKKNSIRKNEFRNNNLSLPSLSSSASKRTLKNMGNSFLKKKSNNSRIHNMKLANPPRPRDNQKDGYLKIMNSGIIQKY